MSDFTMESFFPTPIIFEENSNEGLFLEGLCDDLKGILNKIIHVDGGKNIKYIKSNQRYLKKTYGRYIEFIDTCTGYQIEWAYDSFQEIFIDGSNPKFIVKQCNDILQEFLFYRHSDYDPFKKFTEERNY